MSSPAITAVKHRAATRYNEDIAHYDSQIAAQAAKRRDDTNDALQNRGPTLTVVFSQKAIQDFLGYFDEPTGSKFDLENRKTVDDSLRAYFDYCALGDEEEAAAYEESLQIVAEDVGAPEELIKNVLGTIKRYALQAEHRSAP